MQIIEHSSNEKDLFINTTDVLFPGIPKENIIIYDIDTTSFEAANGCVFLIGTLCCENDALIARYYFSEDISEELAIIKKFLELSEKYSIFLSYKGESFDIPFIGKRLYALQNGQLYNTLQTIRTRSYDLFSEITHLKTGLGLTSTKLESLKQLLGQKTPERISGESINKFYVEHISGKKLKSLLEISRRPENTGFISEYIPKPLLDDLSHISPDTSDRHFNEILARNRENMEAVLYLMRLSHLFVMRQGKFEASLTDGIQLYARERDFSISIPLESKHMEIKQFFPNFKDYYYLPGEDMAVHRSLAEFIDSNSKKKATSKTAYRRIVADFIHLPKAYAKSETNRMSPQYKISYESEEYYQPADELRHFASERLKELTYYFTVEYGSNDIESVLIPIVK